jgi:hypothetical protein
MERVVTKTVDALSRLGERLERRLSTGEDDYDYSSALNRSGSDSKFSKAGSAFHRPLDKKLGKTNYDSAKKRDLVYGGAKKYSSDNLAASPSGNSSFNNYRQNGLVNPQADRMNRGSYGNAMGGPMNYGYQGGYAGSSAAGAYGGSPGNVGYAPDYYIAERRQLELVPAPPPRYIRQQVPVPYPVDRPVPQPYPVEVPRPVPVDRPYPVPVRQLVPVDRPVPVCVPYPVRSPTPPPVQVPVAVPVPCYIPVGVPVPSPPPSPVMVENSVTYTQRWTTGSPAMMNQQNGLVGSPMMMNDQRCLAGSPVMMNQQSYRSGSPMMMNQQGGYMAGSSEMMNQQGYRSGSPMMMNQQGSYTAGSLEMMNQQSYRAGSPAMGMNPYQPYGNGSFNR